MVSIDHHKVVSRRRVRNYRIRRGIKEMGQSMSIMQVIEETRLVASIGGLHVAQIRVNFI
jgi:hypothetical protein